METSFYLPQCLPKGTLGYQQQLSASPIGRHRSAFGVPYRETPKENSGCFTS